MRRGLYKIGEEIETYRTRNIFTVKEEPQKGGLGVVYIAERQRDGKLYALKTFQEDVEADRGSSWEYRNEMIKKIEWESQVWIVLGKHRNIVQAHWFDLSKDYEPFLIMEYIEGFGGGVTLSEWMKDREGTPPDIPVVLNFAIQTLTGLIYARDTMRRELNRAFIHRDIKPGNLFITRDGTLKVSDFGLVRAFSRTEEPGGTPNYMPPEQWEEREVEEKTDVYALGCTIYRMIKGEPPFRRYGRTLEQIRKAHMEAQPDPLERVPDQLNRIILKCLEKESGARPSFCELRDELQKLHQEIKGHRVEVRDEPEPLSADDWNSRGIAFNQLGLIDKSISCYDEAISLDTSDARFYLNRGNAYFRLEWFDESMEDYRRAIELKPDMVRAYIGMGDVLSRRQRYSEALECYDAAERSDPDEPMIYWGRGIVYAMMRDYDAAISELRRSLKLNPQLAEVWFNMGNIHLCKGDYEAAERCYKEAIRINPRYTEAYKSLAQIYGYQGRIEEWQGIRDRLDRIDSP